MPRPRFDKLPEEKRERILEAAAKEFVAHGYDGASMNRMLAEAGISKGAAYYYFDDKADLYATAVLHYSQELLPDSFDPSTVTAERYWDEITALYRHQFTSYADRPWVFGLAKAGGAFSAEMMAQGTAGRVSGAGSVSARADLASRPENWALFETTCPRTCCFH